MRFGTGITLVLAAAAAFWGSLQPGQFRSGNPTPNDYAPVLATYGASLRAQSRRERGIASVALDGLPLSGVDRYLVYDSHDSTTSGVLRRFRTPSLEFCALRGETAAPQFTVVTVECL